MASSPLPGRRIVSVSQCIAGPVYVQILADFGAGMLKVGPVARDPSRSLAGTRSGSACYLALDTGKPAIALDLHRAEDRDRLDDLLSDADALVTVDARRTLENLTAEDGPMDEVSISSLVGPARLLAVSSMVPRPTGQRRHRRPARARPQRIEPADGFQEAGT